MLDVIFVLAARVITWGMMLAHFQQNMTKHISIPGVEILKPFII